MYLMRVILWHQTVYRIFRILNLLQRCFFRGFLIADRHINLELSGEWLDLTVKHRALRLPEILARIIDKRTNTVILDNLESLAYNINVVCGRGTGIC